MGILVKYFKLEEFDCQETGENKMDPDFLEKLDELRHAHEGRERCVECCVRLIQRGRDFGDRIFRLDVRIDRRCDLI